MNNSESFTWNFNQENIDWLQLSELYRLAPLGEKAPDKLKLVFTNSLFKVFVFDAERLIGVGRCLADGFDCSYICDVAIHPDYQGGGLGKKIVEQLIELSSEHQKIILYANPGKEGFYTKLGFKKMNTAMAIFSNEGYAIRTGVVSDR